MEPVNTGILYIGLRRGLMFQGRRRYGCDCSQDSALRGKNWLFSSTGNIKDPSKISPFSPLRSLFPDLLRRDNVLSLFNLFQVVAPHLFRAKIQQRAAGFEMLHKYPANSIRYAA